MKKSEEGALSLKEIQHFEDEFAKDKQAKLLRNAVSRNPLSKVAMDWDRFSVIDHTFSNVVKGEYKKVCNQKVSGRCWLFAGLNMLRIHMAKKYDLEEFEFSQSYLFFYDKLERSNYFLKSILATTDEPYDSRLTVHLLTHPLGDGGQWDMFVNLINKYGLVPQSVMPDSFAATNSNAMNYILTLKLREYALTLRTMVEEKATAKSLQEAKQKMLEEVYRILVLHLGTPPTHFSWQYTDKKHKFHSHRKLTPTSFARKIVNYPLEDMLCLVHSPRKKVTPYYELLTVDYLGNVVEGHPVRYINVPIDVLKQATMDSLLDDEAVWFGCDVGKFFDRELGICDDKLYDYSTLYNVDFPLTKEERLYYGESQMTHAMLFTGVNVVDKKPVKWRVENSWGEKCGKQGYMIMTDTWFDEYMFEVAVHKKYVSKKVQEVLHKDPIHLPPWDPMGALA